MTDKMPSLVPTIRLHRIASEKSELLGYAELVVGGAFVIKDIRIVQMKPEGGKAGETFIAFPAKKGGGQAGDKYFDIAHPITAEAHRTAVEAILKAYEKALKGA